MFTQRIAVFLSNLLMAEDFGDHPMLEIESRVIELVLDDQREQSRLLAAAGLLKK